jgi:hypothetical protein
LPIIDPEGVFPGSAGWLQEVNAVKIIAMAGFVL